MTKHILRLWLLLCFLSLSSGCGRPPTQIHTPLVPGSLHGTLSLQLTSSKDASPLFNMAAFAERLDAPARTHLKANGFDIRRDAAQQHLVVHVRHAGRGSGTVRFFCELEVYVYSSWPGRLGFGRNQVQDEAGRLRETSPQLHASLRLENRRRERVSEGTELDQGAEHCASQLAQELATLRERIPALANSPEARSETFPEPAPEQKAVAAELSEAPTAPFEVVRRLEVGPGNLTLTPSGRLIVSLHQFFKPEYPVAEVDAEGRVTEFAGVARLDSVLGVQSDENGVVWMLDSGMKSTHKARLVGYHSVREKVVTDIDLTSVMPKDAFFNDLVIDLDHEVAYLADPAGGKNAAIVVVDLKSGKARRVLEGQVSVVPEDVDLFVEGEPVEIERPDGSVLRPRVGLNPIAADADNEWLYFGPMHGSSLYRIKTEALRDSSLSPEKLASAVERFSDKPICDGISIDDEGNIYLADLANNAVVRVSAGGVVSTVVSDPRLAWVDAFSFGPDGKLYAVVNQLHRSAPLNRGTDVTQRPFLIITVPVEVPGTVGR